jgi:hypothetical protein
VSVAARLFLESLVKNVFPDIDQRCPVIANGHKQAIAGLSMGSGIPDAGTWPVFSIKNLIKETPGADACLQFAHCVERDGAGVVQVV